MREAIGVVSMVLAVALAALISFALTPSAYTCIGYCDDTGRFNFIHESR